MLFGRSLSSWKEFREGQQGSYRLSENWTIYWILKLLKLPSMAYRRTRRDMIEVYKRCHELYKNVQLIVMSTDTKTRGHSLKLHLQSCTTRVRHNFFSQRVMSWWNSLLEDVVSAILVDSFKNRLDNHWKNIMYNLDMNRSVTVL